MEWFLICLSLNNRNPTENSIAWVQDHVIPLSQARKYFRTAIVAMSDLDLCRLRSSVLHQIDGPFFTLAKKRRDWDVQHVRLTPNGYVDYNPIIMAEPRPLF